MYAADRRLLDDEVGKKETTRSELIRQIVYQWAIKKRLAPDAADHTQEATLVALQKQILKEKGNLTLNISDPFQWCYKYRFNGTFLRMNERDINYFNTRTIGLTFNYRFGKVNNEHRQHVIASQEEQNR